VSQEDTDEAVKVYTDPSVGQMSGDVYPAHVFQRIVAQGQRAIPGPNQLGLVNFGIKDEAGKFLGIVQLGTTSPWNHVADQSIKVAEGHYGITGYHLKPETWGKGIATEATGRVFAYAFEDLKLPGIFAEVIPSNKGSARVLEKQGFVKVAKAGEIDGSDHFLLTREKFESLKDQGPARAPAQVAAPNTRPIPRPEDTLIAVAKPASAAAAPANERFGPGFARAMRTRPSTKRPIVLELEVADVAESRGMDQALSSTTAKVEGTGFEFAGSPPKGKRLITITDEDMLDEVMEIVLEYQEAIPRVTVKSSLKYLNVSPEALEALEKAAPNRPVTLHLGVISVKEADEMDTALRSFGAKVEGSGFPNESTPPQGTRQVTVSNKSEAEKLKEIMDKYYESILEARLADEPAEAGDMVDDPDFIYE
jgi:RimJ/RimL family protein N-acetyltransferase